MGLGIPFRFSVFFFSTVLPSINCFIKGMCSFRYYEDDQEVASDNELQELVNELSADGKQGDFGGKGMVRLLS